MNYLNLDSPKEPEKKDKPKRGPTQDEYVFAAVAAASLIGLATAVLCKSVPMFFITLACSAAFLMAFTIEWYQSNKEEKKSTPAFEDLFLEALEQIEVDTDPEPEHEGVLTWTCSYCNTVNTWCPTGELIRCAHCGARYDGDKLVRR